MIFFFIQIGYNDGTVQIIYFTLITDPINKQFELKIINEKQIAIGYKPLYFKALKYIISYYLGSSSRGIGIYLRDFLSLSKKRKKKYYSLHNKQKIKAVYQAKLPYWNALKIKTRDLRKFSWMLMMWTAWKK